MSQSHFAGLALMLAQLSIGKADVVSAQTQSASVELPSHRFVAAVTPEMAAQFGKVPLPGLLERAPGAAERQPVRVDGVDIYPLEIPTWYQHSPDEDMGYGAYAAAFEKFFTTAPPSVVDALCETGRVRMELLAPEVRPLVTPLAVGPFCVPLASADDIESSLAAPEAEFDFRLVPCVDVYDGQDHWGRISLDKDAPNFSTTVVRNPVMTTANAQLPVLIVPKVTIPESIQGRRIRLSGERIYSLKELLRVVVAHAATKVEIVPPLEKSEFLVSGGKWMVQDLLNAVAVAGGIQFEARSRWLGAVPCRANLNVASVLAIRQGMHESLARLMTALEPYLARPAFRAKLEPFGEAAFKDNHLIPRNELSPAAVARLAPSMPTWRSQGKVLIACRLSLYVDCRSMRGSGSFALDLSETMADYPLPLTGNMYPHLMEPADAYREWGAKLTYREEKSVRR